MAIFNFFKKQKLKKSDLSKSIDNFKNLWTISDINNILEIEDKNSLVIALYGYLCNKSSYGENMEKFTIEESTVYLCQVFEAEVNNGGISQFIFNSSGDYTHETLEALKTINAFKTAPLIEKIISIFPNKKVPNDRNIREEIFHELCDNADIEDLIETIDNQFYEYEDDLEDLNYNYIISNKSKFV